MSSFNNEKYDVESLSVSFQVTQIWNNSQHFSKICAPPDPDTMRACCMLSHFSCVWLFATLWTEHCQAPLSMGFSGQEYWSGLAFPPPGHLPDPGFKPLSESLESPALADRFFTSGATWAAQIAHPNRRLTNANVELGCISGQRLREQRWWSLLRTEDQSFFRGLPTLHVLL